MGNGRRRCKRFPEKRYHETEQGALRHIESLEEAGKGCPDYNAYKCGNHWHVGHNKAKFEKRIKAALGSGRAQSKTAGRR